jgi:DNA-binding transcriptional LysR family regulator
LLQHHRLVVRHGDLHHDLDAEPLLTEPLLVALAATDPLAARPQLRLADLAGRTLPGGSLACHGPPAAPWGSDAARDRPPDPAAERKPPAGPARAASNLAEIFSLVETGSAVFFVPASLAQRYRRAGIAYRPVTDLPAATLVIAWPRDTRSPAVAAFVRAACTVAATVQTGTATQKAAS